MGIQLPSVRFEVWPCIHTLQSSCLTAVPERGAMRLTGHTSRTIFDRDPIIHEQELLKAEDEFSAHSVSPPATRAAPSSM